MMRTQRWQKQIQRLRVTSGPVPSGKGDPPPKELPRRGLCLQSHHGHLPWELRPSHLQLQPTASFSQQNAPVKHHRRAKLRAKLAGKPAVKPPPKSITPLSAHAAAKPPPKAVTSKAATEKEDQSMGGLGEGQSKVAERERLEAAAPKSPPLFAPEWQRFTSRESFLQKTAETYRLDPNSAEGYNHHVASYYYVSTDWGVSHPQSYSSIMLKSDSKQSHRWTCVHCRPSHPEIADHKTVEEGMIHWWRNPLSPLILGLVREGNSRSTCHHRRSLQSCLEHRLERSTPSIGRSFPHAAQCFAQSPQRTGQKVVQAALLKDIDSSTSPL